ncbi:MAG: response regulator, partial [Proteobacteria bacterium]
CEILEMSGFAVRGAGSGNEALGLLRDGLRPAVFLLDLGLPDITPEEFYQQFRVIPGAEEIPLVLASGRADLNSWAIRFGADRTMQKPYDFDALLSLAADYCQPSDDTVSSAV